MTSVENNLVSDSVMTLTQQRNFSYFLAIVALISVSPSTAADNISLSELTRCFGRVEIYHNNSWQTICHNRWDMTQSTVLCKQLNCGTAMEASARFGKGSGNIWPHSYTCKGQESSLKECSQTEPGNQPCHHNQDAGVFCSGALQQPSISLSSPDGGLIRFPGHAEITRGYRFVFTCSINSSYTPGSFILMLSGYNLKNSTETSNNSVSFEFSKAGYEHQGNYSCVYQVKVEQTHRSNEAESIHVTIRYSWLYLLIYSLSAGIALLLLMVLLVVCLVRKRQKVKQQHALNEIYRQRYEEDADEDENEEGDYVNVAPQDTNKQIDPEEEEEDDHDYELGNDDLKDMKGPAAAEHSDKEENISDDHDYELMENEDDHIKSVKGFVTVENKEEVSDEDGSSDENDYVNLADSDQFVEIYGSQMDIYQNV